MPKQIIRNVSEGIASTHKTIVESKWRRYTAAGLTVAFMPLYYGVLGQWMKDPIPTTKDVVLPKIDPKQSITVAMVANLMDTQLKNGWRPSDTVFNPQYFLVDLPAYQDGMKEAVESFALVMKDHLARNRGLSVVDPGVRKAFELFIRSSTDFAPYYPDADTVSRLRKAVNHYKDFNNRLSQDKTKVAFEIRPDNLGRLFERLTLDLGDKAASLENLAVEGNTIGLDVQREYYRNRGYLFASYVILKGIGEDYKQVIDGYRCTNLYDKMMDTMEKSLSSSGASLVVNSNKDTSLGGSHLRVMAGDVNAIARILGEMRSLLPGSCASAPAPSGNELMPKVPTGIMSDNGKPMFAVYRRETITLRS